MWLFDGRTAVASLIWVASLFLTSCVTTKTDDHAERPSQQPQTSLQPAGYDTGDIQYATSVIAHYEQTTEMTALVPGRSAHPEIVRLAIDIAAAEKSDADTMKVFLVQWKENPDANTGRDGRGATSQQEVDSASVARMRSLTGTEFDTLWLQTMIVHQQGAIDMATVEVAAGDNVDAVGLAKQARDSRQAQLNLMQQLLPK